MKLPRIEFLGAETCWPTSCEDTAAIEKIRQSVSTQAFSHRPTQTLRDYESVRQRSMLGQIFRFANGLHDHVDNVVVLGVDPKCSSAAVLHQACCEPYRNLFTRAERGSKPRVFFHNAMTDNDACDAIIGRIIANRHHDAIAERRTAIVVVDPSGDDVATQSVLLHCVDEMPNDDPSVTPRWILPVTRRESPLWRWGQRLGCPQILEIEADATSSRSVFGTVDLLVAAISGLDCIRFLLGAHAVSESFLNTASPMDRRFLIAAQGPDRHRWHTDVVALQPLVDWLNQPRDASSWGVPTMWTHVRVNSVRADIQRLRNYDYDLGVPSTVGQGTHPDLAREKADQWESVQTERGSAVVRIFVEEVDTYGLGQLFQIGLIVDALQSWGRFENGSVH